MQHIYRGMQLTMSATLQLSGAAVSSVMPWGGVCARAPKAGSSRGRRCWCGARSGMLRACVVAVVCGLILPAAGQQSQSEVALRRALFQDYSMEDPPKGMTTVQVQLSINQFIEISTKLQTLRMHGWWRLYWTDPRLSWVESQWNVSFLVMPSTKVWVPDVVIYESVAASTVGPQLVTCYSGGSCYLLSQQVFSTGCPMQLAKFPFDTQKCNFTVGSNSYDQSVVDIVPRIVGDGHWIDDDDALPAPAAGVDINDFRSNQEFLMLRVMTLARLVKYGCCPNPYPVLVIEFTLMRQALTYVYGMIVPLILATTVGMLAILMPAPVSGSRPGLNISTMFTVAAIYITASNKLPDAGQWSLIGLLYIVSFLCCLCMACISIMATAVALHRTEQKGKLDTFRSLFLHHDADKNGTLDQQEVAHALACLNVNSQQQKAEIMHDCGMSKKKEFTISDFAEICARATSTVAMINQSCFGKVWHMLIDPPKALGKFNKRDDDDDEEDVRSAPFMQASPKVSPHASPRFGPFHAPYGPPHLSADFQHGLGSHNVMFDPATGMAKLTPANQNYASIMNGGFQVNGFRFGHENVDQDGVSHQSQTVAGHSFGAGAPAQFGDAKSDFEANGHSEANGSDPRFIHSYKKPHGRKAKRKVEPRTFSVSMADIDLYVFVGAFSAFWLFVCIQLIMTDPKCWGGIITPANEKNLCTHVLVDERTPKLGGSNGQCRYTNRQSLSYASPAIGKGATCQLGAGSQLKYCSLLLLITAATSYLTLII
jgi:nicotinic acetylcholine receptor